MSPKDIKTQWILQQEQITHDLLSFHWSKVQYKIKITLKVVLSLSYHIAVLSPNRLDHRYWTSKSSG